MINSISKLFLSNGFQNASSYGFKQISTQVFPLQFRASPALWAEPMKKKKRADPAILRAREEKKKRRIMKEIRKLERQGKLLKPIESREVPSCLIDDLGERQRKITIPEEISEKRILVLKEWTKIKLQESASDLRTIHRLVKSQKHALDELRLESEELYQAAVRIDENLIPFKFKGPTETPKKDDYPFPDGAYVNVPEKWD